MTTLVDRADWPVHRPAAPDAPIPGRHWFSGCDPDHPCVDPTTGVCEGCGRPGCPACGREDCPDHATDNEAAAPLDPVCAATSSTKGA